MREERQHHKYLQKKSRERKREEKTSMRKKMRGVVKPGQEAGSVFSAERDMRERLDAGRHRGERMQSAGAERHGS